MNILTHANASCSRLSMIHACMSPILIVLTSHFGSVHQHTCSLSSIEVQLKAHTWTHYCSLELTDIYGQRFTPSTIAKANTDYKKLYYGLKNLAPSKKEAIEKIVIEDWETLKKERGIKHSGPQKKKAKI
jgi:hypothetical protein